MHCRYRIYCSCAIVFFKHTEIACGDLMFCSRLCTIPAHFYCDGRIDCPWLTNHDEKNCSQCPSFRPNRCDCNAVGNHTCIVDSTGVRTTCYGDSRKCDRGINKAARLIEACSAVVLSINFCELHDKHARFHPTFSSDLFL